MKLPRKGHNSFPETPKKEFDLDSMNVEMDRLKQCDWRNSVRIKNWNIDLELGENEMAKMTLRDVTLFLHQHDTRCRQTWLL